MSKCFLTKIVLVFSLLFTTNIFYGQNVTVQLIAEGSLEEIQNEISQITDINTKINDLGWTALHAAVRFGRNDIVKFLVDQNADLNVQDNAGQTPLLVAVESGQLNTVTHLIEKGVNVNIASNNGDNPLSMSQKIGLNKISDLLLQNNAQLPEQDVQSQGQRGTRMGMNNMMPGIRRGPGGNTMEQEDAAPEMPGSIENTFGQNANAVGTGNLDPCEVQARIQKYPGLTEAIVGVENGSKSELKQWRTLEKDNRTTLFSAIRKQYISEIQFVLKTATEEKAQKTIEQIKKLEDSRKDTYAAINRAVRDQETTTTTSRTTTNTRRTTTTTNTRANRRGTTTTQQTNTSTQATESRYSPEVQAEIDLWLNSDVTNMSGRMSLLESVNGTILKEINTIKQTATGEKTEKTVAAIDGLLLARQIAYNELVKEFQGNIEEQVVPIVPEITDMQNMPEYDEQEMMNQRGMRGQTMPTGRGTRGR